MMAPITRRDVIAHQSVVPWPSQVQVGQDLLLCRAMAALFDDDFLQNQISDADNLKKVGLPLPRTVTFNDAVPAPRILMFPDLWLRAEWLGQDGFRPQRVSWRLTGMKA